MSSKIYEANGRGHDLDVTFKRKKDILTKSELFGCFNSMDGSVDILLLYLYTREMCKSSRIT
jgi:hypothetical protein